MKGLILACTALCASAFADTLPEYTLDTLEPSVMESFQDGTLQGILKINVGDTIPLSFEVGGSVLALSEQTEPLYLKAKAPFYVKCDNGTFTFSHDQQEWKPFEEFFGGVLQADFGVNDETGPFGKVSLTLDPKSDKASEAKDAD